MKDTKDRRRVADGALDCILRGRTVSQENVRILVEETRLTIDGFAAGQHYLQVIAMGAQHTTRKK